VLWSTLARRDGRREELAHGHRCSICRTVYSEAYPLEGYRERCATKTILGTRVAAKPIELGIPITIARMSSIALTWIMLWQKRRAVPLPRTGRVVFRPPVNLRSKSEG